MQLLVAQAERQATVSVWEDLHWADPSSLEFLSLLIEQIPTTKLLLVLTFRPEFTPPWKPRSHISQLVLNRLGKKQVEAMIEKVAAGKALSAEVIEQIRVKTDGVPLFVEELTKSVVESGDGSGDGGSVRNARTTLAFPRRCRKHCWRGWIACPPHGKLPNWERRWGESSRMNCCKPLRPLSETDLQTALAKLVEAEILYQRGVGRASTLLLQACPDSRHGLSIVTQEHPAAVSPADCPGVGRTLSRDQRDPA